MNRAQAGEGRGLHPAFSAQWLSLPPELILPANAERLGHQCGKVRRSGLGPGFPRQPGRQPVQVDRRRRRHMPHMGLHQANRTGTSQVVGLHPSGYRPFDARTASVLCGRVFLLLLRSPRLQRLKLFLWAQRQRPPRALRRRRNAPFPLGTGATVRSGKPHRNAVIAAGVLTLLPPDAGVALRTGGPAAFPIQRKPLRPESFGKTAVGSSGPNGAPDPTAGPHTPAGS